MLTVQERGQFVATMRYLHVWLMETLAAWTPTTPEMEAKLLFGEHIWDVAQHADALGKRTFELRLPLQHSQPPAQGYLAFLAETAAIIETPRRLAAVYDLLIPAFVTRYRAYLDRTDALSDGPTVRILDHYFLDTGRMREASRALRQELPALELADSGWLAERQRTEAGLELIASHEKAPVATL